MSNVTIGRLRGGFCVYWDDPETGRRRRFQLAARTRAEAEAEARDRYLKEVAGHRGSTVADIWTAYIDHLGAKPTAKTMGYTGKAVLAHFGHLRPDQIQIADSRAYVARRKAEGRKQGTIWTELGHLRSALHWADKMGLIDRMPPLELPSKPDSKVKPLRDEEI